jgi:hypothetical protein
VYVNEFRRVYSFQLTNPGEVTIHAAELTEPRHKRFLQRPPLATEHNAIIQDETRKVMPPFLLRLKLREAKCEKLPAVS